MIDVGDMAPDFELRDTEGKPVRLSEFQGKKTVFPNRFLSDFWPHGAVSEAYGAFNDAVGMSLRHALIVGREVIVRFVQRDETREARDQGAWRKVLAELSNA